jgi:Ca-activated chloride channel family protein
VRAVATEKKLVIIGDGDNTAGHVSSINAAAEAKKLGIKIYTIGVGTSGVVPYGRDASGKPNMIDKTFTDKQLKEIAAKTGGKYYWAKDAMEVQRILGEIFK